MAWTNKNVISDELIDEVVPMRETLGPDDWKKEECPLETDEEFESRLSPLPEISFEGLNDDNYWETCIPQLPLQPLDSNFSLFPQQYPSETLAAEDDDDYMEELNISF